ncbi:MAG TPA: hypothetical protein VH113_03995 [Gemmatimonadales bacterium]|nr:hypothetical protein [Gemmatimonadales bacterium]
MTAMQKGLLAGWSLVAAGLLVTACENQTETPNRPAATQHAAFPPHWGGGEECTPLKFTGGGRIDPPNPDFPDGASGVSTMTGKVTFGFNVFLGTDANGNCVVTKGEIEVVDHPSQTSWHVSIHDGANSLDGSEVMAFTYDDDSGRGVCVQVGTNGMLARVNGNQGTEETRLTACDNGEPGSQQPGISSSGPDALNWETLNHGSTDLTYLTGGNIQAH